MKKIKYLFPIFVWIMISCTDLDIPPKNIFGEKEIYTNTDGVLSQLARIYGLIPMNDFRFHFEASGLYNVAGNHYTHQFALTGEAMSRGTGGAEQENNSYWDGPYRSIREINMFMEKLSKYADLHTESNMKLWTGEARFARAYIYYSLVERYGGVPLVDKVLDYPISVDMEGTKLPRNSEKDIWDFIASDLDYAISNLPETNQKGRANKYVAAAFKSRAMLHAGCIAKYTPESMKYTADGVLLCGMDPSLANGYFKAAFDAAMLVQQSNKYSLHTSDMGTTPASLVTNFANIFLKDTEENIFVRYFNYTDSRHGWDEDMQPLQTKTGGNSDILCPTVDFVEMFDGIDKDENGRLKVFDNNGNYKLFTSPIDFFVNAEPRLKATVIFPMDNFKNQVIELRRGIYKKAVGDGLKRLAPEGHIDGYQALGNPDLYLGQIGAAPIPIKGGGTMSPVGKSGMANAWDWGNYSGFFLRKYLNPTPGITTHGAVSETDWIEIRYAEVLLNMAEAAYELLSAGQTGASYRTLAFQAINAIRNRAGATLLPSESALNDINIIRTERRKELAFEGKAYWDLKRWRVIHEEQNNRRYRALQPFYSDDAEKYFLDIHYQESRGGYSYIYTYDTRYYYQPIPGGEITKNPNCIQNKGY